MDLRIQITDENGRLMDRFIIYQDGSDSIGTALIRDMIGREFIIEDSIDSDEDFMVNNGQPKVTNN